MISEVLMFLKDILFVAGYVNNSTSFPEPLSKEEEKKYVLLCSQGDEDARAKLIEHNLRLVAHIAKKYTKGRTADSDDIISIGTIGLIKAVSSFDPSKGMLATYAAKCIENEILMYFRSEKKNANDVSLDEPIGRDSDGNEVSLCDKLYSDDESVEDEVYLSIFSDNVRSAMTAVLDEKERQVIQMRYCLSEDTRLAQREVAQVLGVSRSYVSRIEKKALTKLSEHFSRFQS